MKNLIVVAALLCTIVDIKARRYRMLVSGPLWHPGIVRGNNADDELTQTSKYIIRSRPISQSKISELRIQESNRAECKEYKDNCLSECSSLDNSIKNKCAQQCQNEYGRCQS